MLDDLKPFYKKRPIQTFFTVLIIFLHGFFLSLPGFFVNQQRKQPIHVVKRHKVKLKNKSIVSQQIGSDRAFSLDSSNTQTDKTTKKPAPKSTQTTKNSLNPQNVVKNDLKSTADKTASTSKKTLPKTKKSLTAANWRKIEESIAKIERQNDKLYQPSRIDIPELNFSASSFSQYGDIKEGYTGDQDTGYEEQLIGYLKQTLVLPESGSVKVKINVDFSGRIVEVLIIETHSDANKKYLETHLKNLILPGFNKQVQKKYGTTFIFNFNSHV
ncbi:MAG: hypothetical protein ACOVOR_00925 [Rhabdochlamydiaceae bacterium]